jgi:hypothetical protein
MYVTSVEIQNIKSLRDVKWVVDPDKAAGWHTILGVNGAGKSAFAKTIALALIGEKQAYALQANWKTWVGPMGSIAKASLTVLYDEPWDSLESNSNQSEDSHGTLVEQGFEITGSNVGFSFSRPVFEDHNSSGTVLGYRRFSAGFGPFRRFTGGGLEFERKLEYMPILAGHISLFDEKAALSSSLEWLRQLKFKALEAQSDYSVKFTIDEIFKFVNQNEFLPGGVKLSEVNSEGVKFITLEGVEVNVLDMSDGFRSVLSLTFELLRLISQNRPEVQIFFTRVQGDIVVPTRGVVLIDEVDAHLHPTWQRKIGPWFTKHFPNMQFIVTTHSPFVCQASEHGTIFVLDGEGGGRFLEGQERDRIIYGDIMDAYSTDVFGGGMTRSDASQEKLSRLAELNNKSFFAQLSETEQAEHQSLKRMMSTDANFAIAENPQ